MKLGKIVCVLAVLVFIGSVNFVRATELDELVLDLDMVPKVKQVNPKIESILVQLHSARLLGNMTSFAKQRGITVHSEIVWDGPDYVVWYDSVRVILDFDDYSEENIEDLESRGVKVETSDGNLVQALVPVFQLQSVSKLSFVKHVRLPLKPTVYMESEGVSVIRATELHGLGIYGAGIKVAILDVGFEGYEAKLGVELPSIVTARSFRADEDITGGGQVHGTACAEIVHDVAPGAQLYLVNIGTSLEFNDAVDWLISEDVKVISFSAGWVNVGPYDGTGDICDVVNDATAQGVFWAGSSGNYAQGHWEGIYQDSDVDYWHEFAPLDETQAIEATAGTYITASLSWDDWPTSDQDYDLYLYNNDYPLGLIAWSENDQTGTQRPTEAIVYQATYTGWYHIAIHEWSVTRSVHFELYSSKNDFQYQVPSSSLGIPADAAGSFTVGATYWGNDGLELFSSRGPTNDMRIKPDVTAPDRVTTSTYYPSQFYGTSASAPHTAGAAALLLSYRPTLTVAQLKSILEGGALDLGDGGKDNLFGAGRINVYNSYLDIEYEVTLPVNFGAVIADGTYSQTDIITACSLGNTITVTDAVQSDGTSNALEELRYVEGTVTGASGVPLTIWNENTPVSSWTAITLDAGEQLSIEADAGLAPGTWGSIVITFTVS